MESQFVQIKRDFLINQQAQITKPLRLRFKKNSSLS